jgi:hypothetical protein
MRSLALMTSVLLIATASSVELQAQTRLNPGAGGGDTGRVAVPRNEPPPAAAPAPTPPPPGRTESAAPPRSASAPAGGQNKAEPRGSRPRGDNPQVGVAVPRPPNRPPTPGGPDFDGPDYYPNYYYYPRLYYPYGYGAFGLGYYYYDPYAWYPGYWNYPFTGYGYGNPTGEIRLKVKPRDAEVFVDGYYAGTVNDFDGFSQALRLEEGPYTIEIRAPGYAPLSINVRIQPGRKINYEGELQKP